MLKEALKELQDSVSMYRTQYDIKDLRDIKRQ